MLCYAMLCYAMLCYAMLCYVLLSPESSREIFPEKIIERLIRSVIMLHAVFLKFKNQ